MTKFRPKPAHFETKSQVCPNSIIFLNTLSDSSVRLLLTLNAIYTCTKNWVACQQDLQNRLGWGPLKMRSTIKNCVEQGYLKVTKPRDKKGGFTTNEFEFDLSGGYSKTYDEKTEQNEEIKPTHNQYEPDDGNPRVGTPRVADHPIPCSKEFTILKEETTTCSVDVFLGLDIEEHQKTWISEKYDQKTIEDAIFYAIHPTTKIKTSLIATIKWACKEKIKYQQPKAEKDAFEKKEKEQADEDIIKKNKSLAEKIISENSHLFSEVFSIKLDESYVLLKIDSGYNPLDFIDKNFEIMLNSFIHNNLRR